MIDSFTSATERHIEVSKKFLLCPLYPLSFLGSFLSFVTIVFLIHFSGIFPNFLFLSLHQVGDGLEIYVVLSKNSPSIQGLRDIRGASELTSTDDGERVFVVRRELKKD